jgi:membrane-bound ClpP family serine protease
MASLTDCGVGIKVVFLLMMQGVLAQEATCYSEGSVAGAVVGTLLVTLTLVGLAYLVWRIYWRSRRGKSGDIIAYLE